MNMQPTGLGAPSLPAERVSRSPAGAEGRAEGHALPQAALHSPSDGLH